MPFFPPRPSYRKIHLVHMGPSCMHITPEDEHHYAILRQWWQISAQQHYVGLRQKYLFEQLNHVQMQQYRIKQKLARRYFLFRK